MIGVGGWGKLNILDVVAVTGRVGGNGYLLM
jgi:hypothetical protein